MSVVLKISLQFKMGNSKISPQIIYTQIIYFRLLCICDRFSAGAKPAYFRLCIRRLLMRSPSKRHV